MQLQDSPQQTLRRQALLKIKRPAPHPQIALPRQNPALIKPVTTEQSTETAAVGSLEGFRVIQQAMPPTGIDTVQAAFIEQLENGRLATICEKAMINSADVCHSISHDELSEVEQQDLEWALRNVRFGGKAQTNFGARVRKTVLGAERTVNHIIGSTFPKAPFKVRVAAEACLNHCYFRKLIRFLEGYIEQQTIKPFEPQMLFSVSSQKLRVREASVYAGENDNHIIIKHNFELTALIKQYDDVSRISNCQGEPLSINPLIVECILDIATTEDAPDGVLLSADAKTTCPAPEASAATWNELSGLSSSKSATPGTQDNDSKKNSSQTEDEA